MFVVNCHGEYIRQLVMLATGLGMTPGEYIFIFMITDPNSDFVGNWQWERGDEFDMVREMCYVP